jgi:hypothetical protein
MSEFNKFAGSTGLSNDVDPALANKLAIVYVYVKFSNNVIHVHTINKL